MSTELAESMATQAISPVNHTPLVALDIQAMKANIVKVQELMRDLMQDGVHYGTIPGMDKPFLWKAGAELTGMLFQVGPYYSEKVLDLAGGHREYQVTCTLRHHGSGRDIGQGLGFCSSLESKYRYRGTQVERTEKEAPRSYWDAKKSGDFAQMERLIGGPGFTVKPFEEGGRKVWYICKKLAEKCENPDPADVFHTVRSQAAKRAFVAAIRSTTPAGTVFHDGYESLVDDEEVAPPPKKVESKPADKPKIDKPQQSSPKQSVKEQSPGKVVETIRAIAGCETVTLDDLEGYAQKPCNQWAGDDYDIFRNIVTELRSGAATPGTFFARLNESN